MSDFSKIKFIRILKTFSQEELKSFDLWLRSPWSNTNKNLIKLFEKLSKFHPTYDNPKLTKERLFKQILPNGKFSNRRMNNLLSEGYLVAEEFVIFQNLKRDQNLQKDLLTKEFQNRHLEEWFFKEADKEIERLENKKIKDWEDHLDLLQLHRRVYHHPNQNPRMQPGGMTIVKMGEQIDLVYLLEKAVILKEKAFRNRLFKNENYHLNSEIKKWLEITRDNQHYSIKLYKIRFAYTEENILEQFLNLREEFLNQFEKLSKREQTIHLFSLLNDSTLLARKKLIKFTEKLPLYKKGLQSEVLYHNGILTPITYYSIVSTSNTINDFDFTSRFIEKYTSKLESQYQKDGKNWALAHTAYRQMKLEKSRDILISHDFNYYFFQLASRLLTTQVFFDLSLINDKNQFYLYNYLDSFEKWLTREKTHSKFIQQSYIRFVQICRRLIKSYFSISFKKEMIDNLYIKEESIQAPDWLDRKTQEILTLRK